jgi:hypothetical protein
MASEEPDSGSLKIDSSELVRGLFNFCSELLYLGSASLFTGDPVWDRLIGCWCFRI